MCPKSEVYLKIYTKVLLNILHYIKFEINKRFKTI